MPQELFSPKAAPPSEQQTPAWPHGHGNVGTRAVAIMFLEDPGVLAHIQSTAIEVDEATVVGRRSFIILSLRCFR